MVPAPFTVVLDANVLFPFTLRDTLLRAAAADFYQLRWSLKILDEMASNLVSTSTTTADKAVRLRQTMERAFPDAMVTGYESLVPAMKNHDKDRHLAAPPPTCAILSTSPKASRRSRRITSSATSSISIPSASSVSFATKPLISRLRRCP